MTSLRYLSWFKLDAVGDLSRVNLVNPTTPQLHTVGIVWDYRD